MEHLLEKKIKNKIQNIYCSLRFIPHVSEILCVLLCMVVHFSFFLPSRESLSLQRDSSLALFPSTSAGLCVLLNLPVCISVSQPSVQLSATSTRLNLGFVFSAWHTIAGME